MDRAEELAVLSRHSRNPLKVMTREISICEDLRLTLFSCQRERKHMPQG